MNFANLSAVRIMTGCNRAKPIAALAACELASLAVARGASMHLALRAAQLCKTAVLPFCPSTHSYDPHGCGECRCCREHSPAGYGFQSRAARSKLADSPSLAIPVRNAG